MNETPVPIAVEDADGLSCPSVTGACDLGRQDGSDVCGKRLWHPPQFNLTLLFQVIALTAIWLVLIPWQNPWSMVQVTIIMLTWIFGCWQTKRAVVLVGLCWFVPFVWMLLIEYPWNEYRSYWVSVWGVAPAIPLSMFMVYVFTQGEAGDQNSLMAISSVVMAVMILGPVTICRFWPRSTPYIVVALAVLAAYFGWVGYTLFAA